MASHQQQRVAERAALLASYRRTYLRLIAVELGMPGMDLREMALREAAELLELAHGLERAAMRAPW